jgi:hypothetical protein
MLPTILENVISVIVQTVPDRGEAWERCRLSLESSDAGRYLRLVQPKDMTMGRHFIGTLKWALDLDSPFTLRLEDDAIVNQHIIHNLWTWPDKDREDFGAGWAFSPVSNTGRWQRRELHGSVGVLLKKSVLPAIIERCERELDEQPDRTDQDLMLSRAIRDSGFFIYIHHPSLVEHPIDVPSTLGHRHTAIAGTSSGRFSASWRRGPC